MAVVAMEVVWIRPSGGDQLGKTGAVGVMDHGVRSSSTSMSTGVKKRAWGEDTEKLMQLMMGHFGSSGSSHSGKVTEGVTSTSTLDLLRLTGSGGDGGVSVDGLEYCKTSSQCVVDEFLEVDPDQQPLPSGWEKCLDLKTGELYFVSKSTGVRTSEDPRRKLHHRQQSSIAVAGAVIAPRTPARPAHEFLASKQEETLRASTPSGSSSAGEEIIIPNTTVTNKSTPATAVPELLSFSTGKRLWNLQLDDQDNESTDLELNLNLSPSSQSCSRRSPAPVINVPPHTQTVCTMEMVEQALKRTEKAMGKREATAPPPPPPLSTSSSFSSLAEPSWSRSSPSTSSSSATSKSIAAHNDTTTTPTRVMNNIITGDQADQSITSTGPVMKALVMGPCTRCLMFVMVNEKDPKCPRCESGVHFESFTNPVKRQRTVL